MSKLSHITVDFLVYRYSYVLNNPLKYTDPSGYWKAKPRWWDYLLGRTAYWIDGDGNIRGGRGGDDGGGNGSGGGGGGGYSWVYTPFNSQDSRSYSSTEYSRDVYSHRSGGGGGSGNRSGNVSPGDPPKETSRTNSPSEAGNSPINGGGGSLDGGDYDGTYLIPAEAYDYSQEEIPEKIKEDFLYWKNGGPWYKLGIRATELFWRDLTAEGNRATVIEVGAIIFIRGFGKVSAPLFHRTIKPGILKTVGRNNYMNRVGNNPDIQIYNNQIRLIGNGPYRGKYYDTGLDPSLFFE